MKTLLTYLLLTLPLLAATQLELHKEATKRVTSTKTPRILFIGNSYSFQVPKVFETIAKAEGKKIHVEQITKGGWTLKKHASNKETLDSIATGKWDIIVLQEQSQIPAFPEDQRAQLMNPAAIKLATAAKKSGAIPIFYQTWGRKDGDKQNAAQFPKDTYQAMQKRLITGYAKASEATGGTYIVPAGEIWQKAIEKKLGESLYKKDGSHPAKAGNYLVAATFYTALYAKEIKAPARKIPDAKKLAFLARFASPNLTPVTK